MSERYSRIFSLEENLYAQGSPIVIKAGALLKDNETSWVIAQLKLSSLSDKMIKLVKVEITAFDTVGRALGAPVTFEYLDLSVARNCDFGVKTPIKLANTATRSYSVRVVEVCFEDNTVWSDTDAVWETLPTQEPISSTYTDGALKGYKSYFGTKANMKACEHKDLWLCTCGAVNKQGESNCPQCGASLEGLKSVDTASLEIEGAYADACEKLNNNKFEEAKAAFEKIRDYKDSEALIKKADEAQAVAHEKKKKTVKIFALIASSIAVLFLIGYFAIYPLIAYCTGNYKVFINMYNVESFKVPNGVTVIKEKAFEKCTSLESVEIPDSVTSIEYCAFWGCTSLESIEFPDSVTSIGVGAFENCTSLESVEIPDSVTSIETYAFYGCSSLTSIIIPDSVTRIGYRALENCTSLESVTIPNSVTSIEEYAFWRCTSLTSIFIPNSVTSIEYGAFKDCPSLKIYCEVGSEPSGWSSYWVYSNHPVVWGHAHSYKNGECICGVAANAKCEVRSAELYE